MNAIETFGIGLNYTVTVNHNALNDHQLPVAQGTPGAP